MKTAKVWLGGLLLISLVLLPISQSYSVDPAGDEQKKINDALDKGVAFLLKKGIKGQELELEILTLVHAGVDPKKNSALAEAIEKIATKTPLAQTYNVALTAMALELLDREKYQMRIAQCAQALVDYQSVNGQWAYNVKFDTTPANAPKVTGEVAKPLEAIITGEGEEKPKEKKPEVKPLQNIIVKRHLDPKKRPGAGDNSNTQFALLGLRAAARSGVTIPEETWKDAAAWFEKCQLGPGGWTYSYTGPTNVQDPGNPYGSISCAALCGMSIAKFYLKQDLTQDAAIQRGLAWIGGTMDFTKNPGAIGSFMDRFGANVWQFYYIYGIERVGAVLDIKQIGNRDWYEEGVKFLLENQSAKDGSWGGIQKDPFSNVIINTCFSILFLKKATPVMVKAKVTGDNEK